MCLCVCPLSRGIKKLHFMDILKVFGNKTMPTYFGDNFDENDPKKLRFHIVRFKMLVPNCPGAILSVFTILVPNCLFSYLGAKLSVFTILVANCMVPNCPTNNTLDKKNMQKDLCINVYVRIRMQVQLTWENTRSTASAAERETSTMAGKSHANVPLQIIS